MSNRVTLAGKPTFDPNKSSEQTAKKRDQLKSVILDNFKSKYPLPFQNPKILSLATAEIDVYVTQTTITEQALQKLDLRIQQIIEECQKIYTEEIHDKGPQLDNLEKTPEPVKVEFQEKSEPSLNKIEESVQTKLEPEIPKEIKKEFPSSVIVSDKKKQEEEEKYTKSMKNKMRDNMKNQLDAQIELKKKSIIEQKQKEKEQERKLLELEIEKDKKEKEEEFKQKREKIAKSVAAQKQAERIFRQFIIVKRGKTREIEAKIS